MSDGTKANVLNACTQELEKCTPEDRLSIARALMSLYSPVPAYLFGDDLDEDVVGWAPRGAPLGYRGRRARL
jgi:hypothetical protein